MPKIQFSGSKRLSNGNPSRAFLPVFPDIPCHDLIEPVRKAGPGTGFTVQQQVENLCGFFRGIFGKFNLVSTLIQILFCRLCVGLEQICRFLFAFSSGINLKNKEKTPGYRFLISHRSNQIGVVLLKHPTARVRFLFHVLIDGF